MQKKARWGLCPLDEQMELEKEIQGWREIENSGDSEEVYWTPIVFPILVSANAISRFCTLLCSKGLKARYHIAIERAERLKDPFTPWDAKKHYKTCWVVHITHLCPDTTLEPNPWHIIPEALDEVFCWKEQT